MLCTLCFVLLSIGCGETTDAGQLVVVATMSQRKHVGEGAVRNSIYMVLLRKSNWFEGHLG